MRKLCVALLLSMLAFPLLGQTVVFEDDMEPTYDPLWSFYLDYGSPNWALTTTYSSSPTHSIFQNYSFSGLESWAVIGPITLGSDNFEITWSEYTTFTTYYEYHGLAIATTDPGALGTGVFTDVTELSTISSSWNTYTYDLSAYASTGDQVWIAFHYDELDGTNWYIDDVTVTELPVPGTLSGITDKTDDIDDSGVVITVDGTPYTTTSGAGGAYTINLPAGTYDVIASFLGYWPDTQSVTITGGLTSTADFTLEPMYTLVSTGFEGGTSPLYGDIIDEGTPAGYGGWEWGDPTFGPAPYEGDYLWGTNIDTDLGYYANSADWQLVLDVDSLDADPYYIEWYQWYSMETGWDGGQFRYSTDDGATWNILEVNPAYDDLTVTGLEGGPGWTSSSAVDWHLAYADLSALAGTITHIVFRLGSDSSVNSYYGWYIDNLTVKGERPPMGYITGTADKTDTGPVGDPGITVSILESAWSNDVTVAGGGYGIDIVPGTYTAVATAPGYTADTVTGIVVTVDDTVEVDFEIDYIPAGVVEGYADLTDTPGPDAGIIVTSHDGMHTGITDVDGYFQIVMVPAGDYVFYGEYPDYNTGSTPLFSIAEGETLMTDTIFLDLRMPSSPTLCFDFDDTDGGLLATPETGGWEWGIPTAGPSAARSTPNCWGTNLDGDYDNSVTWNLDIPFADLSTSDILGLDFWHWYYIESFFDDGSIFYSTDDGASWTPAMTEGGDDYFEGTSGAWVMETVIFPEDAVTHFRFQLNTDSSVPYEGWYIDDVCLYEAIPGPTGTVTGLVYSTGTYEPIAGALVTGPGGAMTYSDEDGYYELTGLPVGPYDVTGHKSGYFPNTLPGMINEYGASTVWIPLTPAAYTGGEGVEIDIAYDHPDTSETVVTICNPTDQDIDFYFGTDVPDFAGAGLFRENATLRNTEMPVTPVIENPDLPVPTPSIPEIGAGLSREMATGDVFTSWDIPGGIDTPWGLGLVTKYDTENLWISDIGINVYVREYTVDGTYTGRYFNPVALWPGVAFIGDMVSDGSGIWLLQVGASNMMYKMNPETFAIIDSLKDPSPASGWGSISQRGLAYDAVEDVFYVGGWNSDAIWKIKGQSWDVPGEEIDAGITAFDCAGVVFHPGRRTVWYITNAPTGTLYEVDYETGTVLNEMAVPPATTYSLGGLDIDGYGRLHYVSMNDTRLYQMDSGYGILPGGIYFEPSYGTLAPGECIDVTIVTSGHQAEPGEYDVDVSFIVDPVVDPIQVPVTINVTPTIDRGWNIVSVPVMPVPNDPWAQLHDDIDPFDAAGSSSQIYAWDPILGRYVVPSEFQRGRGYYLWGWYNDTHFDIYGDAYTSDYMMNLEFYPEATRPGWHVIGNPFNERINWDLVTEDPGFVGVDETAWFFSTHTGWMTYTPGLPPMGATEKIDPYVGFWVKLDDGAGTIPFRQDYTFESFGKKAKTKEAEDYDMDSIILRISAESRLGDDRRVDYWNYIGTKAEALDALPLDDFDHEEMSSTPPGYDPLEASFIQGTHVLKDEFKSRHGSNESKTWNFRVTGLTNGTVVTVSWPVTPPSDPADGSQGTSEIPDYYTLTAVHPTTGEEINMREEGEITFIYNGAAFIEFTVSSLILDVEDDEITTIPETFTLLENTPNPFNASTELKFGLPEDAPVSLEVYDVLGNRISTLISNNEMTAGYHSVIWDGRTDDNSPVASGIYLYKITAGDYEASRTMILVE